MKIKSFLSAAILISVSASLLCCVPFQKAETSVATTLGKVGPALGLTPAAQANVQVVLQNDALSGLADLALLKPASLKGDAAKAVDDVAAQVQSNSSNKVVVAISAAGRKALADYLAGDSAAKDLTDAGLAALGALAAPAAPVVPATP